MYMCIYTYTHILYLYLYLYTEMYTFYFLYLHICIYFSYNTYTKKTHTCMSCDHWSELGARSLLSQVTGQKPGKPSSRMRRQGFALSLEAMQGRGGCLDSGVVFSLLGGYFVCWRLAYDEEVGPFRSRSGLVVRPFCKTSGWSTFPRFCPGR